MDSNDNYKTPNRPIPDVSLEIKRKVYPEKRSPDAIAQARRKLDFSEISPSTCGTSEAGVDTVPEDFKPETLKVEKSGNVSADLCGKLDDVVIDDNTPIRERNIELKSTQYNFDFKTGKPFTEEQCSKLLDGQLSRYEWSE